MGGIGSRRWAKFCKYLCRAGWQIHVITTQYPWVDPVQWGDDVKNLPGLKVVRLPSGYPSILLKTQTGRKKIINWLTSLFRLIHRLIFWKWLNIDYGGLWVESLVSFATKYIREHEIQNLVVTGPPFSLCLAGTLIKSNIPSIQLIFDYRDPWSNDVVSTSKIHDVNNHINHLAKEALALQVADKIVVVSQQMSDELRNIFSLPREKVTVIYNGFDPEDYYRQPKHRLSKNSNKIRIVYLGTIGLDPNGRLAAVHLIAKALDLLAKNIRCSFEINFYSDIPRNFILKPFSPDERAIINFFPMVDNVDLQTVLENSEICLSINRIEDGNAFGTKVFDYMGAKKPILLVSPIGELRKLLEQSGGYVIDYNLQSAVEVLQRIYNDYYSDRLLSISDKITSRFNLSVLAQQFNSLLT